METPCAPGPVSTLVPVSVIVPEVLVIELGDAARLIPTLPPPPDSAAPVMEIFPVAVETRPPPLMLTPSDAPLLKPLVPFNVIEFVLTVLNVPAVREIPWHASVIPFALAVMAIVLPVDELFQ